MNIQTYKEQLNNKIKNFQVRLVEYIANKLRNDFNLSLASDLLDGTGRNANVTVSVSKKGNTFTISAIGDDAVWVEFGAGIYHNGSVGESPNPYGEALGFTIGSYNKGNGAKEVWGYYENEELVLTHGTKATKPIANLMENINIWSFFND